MPPAFVLSQDQTLKLDCPNTSIWMIARLKFSIHELSSRPKSWNSDSFQDSLRRAFYFLHRTTFIRTSPPTNPFHNILQFQTARPKSFVSKPSDNKRQQCRRRVWGLYAGHHPVSNPKNRKIEFLRTFFFSLVLASLPRFQTALIKNGFSKHSEAVSSQYDSYKARQNEPCLHLLLASAYADVTNRSQ